MVRDLVLVYLVGSCVGCALNVVINLFRSVIRVCRVCTEKALMSSIYSGDYSWLPDGCCVNRRSSFVDKPSPTKESFVCSQIDGCVTLETAHFSPFLYLHLVIVQI